MKEQKHPVQRILLTTLTFFALTLLLAAQASAGQVNLFSKTYVKEKGKPVTYTDQISVSPSHTNLRLVVNNGAGEDKAVKNCEIVLNGVTVLTSSDLRGSTGIDKTVSLPWLEENELEVTLRGQAGNALSIELLADFYDPLRL